MSVIDPNYDMPFPDMQQTGSFIGPVSLPALGPLAGPLVALPCINPDWLRLLLGCVDQLRNPSTWAGLTPSQTVDALGQVEDLRVALQQAGTCVICPEIRLQDCVLQYSCDGGSSWTDVAGWTANLSSCIQNALPPQVPPNPGGNSHDQHACNLAGYLASRVIQETMTIAHTVLAASGNELTFAADVMAVIGYAFPLTYYAVIAFHDFYAYLSGQVLSEVNTASTDPSLWSLVTCAIYEGIRVAGYVDATNFGTVATNLGAISYGYSWVAPSLHNYWLELGLGNIQSQQAVGALEDADCSGCTNPPEYCFEWDWTVAPGAWTVYDIGTWTAGLGWTEGSSGGNNGESIEIHIPATNVKHIVMGVLTINGSNNVDIFGYLSGTLVLSQSVVFGPSGSLQYISWTGSNSVDRIILRNFDDSGSGGSRRIVSAHIDGSDDNPFGTDNCTPIP